MNEYKSDKFQNKNKEFHIKLPGLTELEEKLNALIFEKDWSILFLKSGGDFNLKSIIFFIAHMNDRFKAQLSSNEFIIIAEKNRILKLRIFLEKWIKNRSKITSQIKINWADEVGAFKDIDAMLKGIRVYYEKINSHTELMKQNIEYLKYENQKILVIDDEEGIRDWLSYELGQTGYTVVTAQNGKEGIKKFIREKFDLVLIDIRMPDMDGITVLKKLKKIENNIEFKAYSNIPIIINTGYTTATSMYESYKAGAADYIHKPFDVKELELCIKVALETAEYQKRCIEVQIPLENGIESLQLQLATKTYLQEQLTTLTFYHDWGVMIWRILKESNSKYLLYVLSHLNGKCIGQLSDNEYIIIDTKEKILQLDEILKDWIIDLSQISLSVGTVLNEEIGKYPDSDSIIKEARSRITEGII